VDIDTLKVKQIQEFLYASGLSYGSKPTSAEDKAPWMISTASFEVCREEANYLIGMGTPPPLACLGMIIQDFHIVSIRLLISLIDQMQMGEHNRLTEHIDHIMQSPAADLYVRWLDKYRHQNFHCMMPFSTRPDVQIVNSQHLENKYKIIEYNVDGSADKGVSEGVNLYSHLFLNCDPLGRGLVTAFLEEICRRYVSEKDINVATILPDTYRTEYEPQNIFFAMAANEAGCAFESQIHWYAVKLNQLVVAEDGLHIVAEDGQDVHIHAVDREFKLPGFIPTREFQVERQIIELALDDKVDILGSPLPLSDKVFMTFIHSLEFEPLVLDALGIEAAVRLQRLRASHAETYFLTEALDEITIAGQTYSWEDILDQNVQTVVKKVGDTIETTGATMVFLSAECSPGDWRRLLTRIQHERGWVLQAFYPSKEYTIGGRRSYHQSHAIYHKSRIRFSPYYVIYAGHYELGNILVTAGIFNREAAHRDKIHKIHGSRGTAYLAVTAHPGMSEC